MPHSLSGSGSRNFFRAPLSVATLLGVLLEPILTIAVLLAVMDWQGEPLDRSYRVLCVLAFALSFPGRMRFTLPVLEVSVDVLTLWVYQAVLMLVCGLLTESIHMFSVNVLLWWFALTPLAHVLAYLLGRVLVLHWSSRRWRRRRVLIVGATALGAKLGKALDDMSVRTFDMLGYFDDRSDSRIHDTARPMLLGNLSQVAEFVKVHGVHQVYITLPMGSQPRIVKLLEDLQDTTASLYFVPDVFGISIIQGRLDDLNGVPVVGLLETPFTGTNAMVKRVADIILALLILALIWPIMLAVAVGVKMSSPGPIIFKQRRNGLDGHEIVVYKFRSMRTMDDGAVVKQATKGDARITPFGAFIRKTSLDELPQFINVLQGRMSIVGPRPHAVAHNEQYRKLIKAYMVRHKVKPGITGWAQVNGHRGETDSVEKMRARVEYDLEYQRNWSVSFDLQIVLKTIRLMLFDRNAY